jgi:tetratricopeptide (TPR) repeat protein
MGSTGINGRRYPWGPLGPVLVVGLLVTALSARSLVADVLGQADELLSTGQTAEAETLLQEAIARQGPGVEALLRLGTAQLLQSKYAESEASLRAALALAPEEPRLLHNLGLLFLRQQRYDEALPYFQQALEVRSWDPESNFYIGWIHERRGNSEEALRSYIAELNVNPTNANAWRQYLALRGAERPAQGQAFPWDMLAIWLVVLGLCGTLYWLKRNYGLLSPSPGFREETEGPELPAKSQERLDE